MIWVLVGVLWFRFQNQRLGTYKERMTMLLLFDVHWQLSTVVYSFFLKKNKPLYETY